MNANRGGNGSWNDQLYRKYDSLKAAYSPAIRISTWKKPFIVYSFHLEGVKSTERRVLRPLISADMLRKLTTRLTTVRVRVKVGEFSSALIDDDHAFMVWLTRKKYSEGTEVLFPSSGRVAFDETLSFRMTLAQNKPGVFAPKLFCLQVWRHNDLTHATSPTITTPSRLFKGSL